MTELAARLVVAPRFQRLPDSAWSSALPVELVPGDEVAVLRIRCGMKDCPGDLGSVARLTTFDGHVSLDYRAPRGFVRDRDSSEAPTFRESQTAKRAARVGLPLEGRRPHRKTRDWDQSAPLDRRGMPGQSYGLDDGKPLMVACNRCPRYVRFATADVQAGLTQRPSAVVG